MDNPFEQQLVSLSRSGLASVAYEAPLPLRRCYPGDTCSGVCRAFHLSLNALQLVALAGPAFHVELLARHWISLIYVTEGEICIIQQNQTITSSRGGCLIVPGTSAVWQSTAFSAVCMMLRPQQLPDLTPAHASPDTATEAMAAIVARAYGRSDGLIEDQLLRLLAATLVATGKLHGADPQLLDRLGLDDQLARMMAVMVRSGLPRQAETHQERRSGKGMDDTFGELLDYIRANLDQPLNLAVLEGRSHYSRRALQYAFQERLGCTVTQWIRCQRLDLAHARLQRAGPGVTVTNVAHGCGYRSLSLFSIEFQQRFHVKPSVLLRQARSPFSGRSSTDREPETT